MDIQARAAKIKLLLLDVDGVLTDGKIVLSTSGEETKNFDVQDGLGILFLKKVGLKCAIITARLSRVVKIRARQIGIDRVYENHYKIESLEGIKRRFKVRDDEICFMGDDFIDISILKRAGLSVSVPNGVDEAKRVAHYITKRRGGEGAVREVCELILKAQGKWVEATKRYFE
ncbi:MAG: HAD hydrolase family protein [Omnitrophica bacterium]|nr:HAD hydrolase family protein [Candidatus Omnitrophota bacterium]